MLIMSAFVGFTYKNSVWPIPIIEPGLHRAVWSRNTIIRAKSIINSGAGSFLVAKVESITPAFPLSKTILLFDQGPR